MNKIVFFSFCILLCSSFVSAQEELSERVSLSLYASAGIPSRQLKKAVDNPIGGAAVGLSTNVLYRLKKEAPVAAGVEFTYLTFGRDKVDATFNSPPYKTTFNYYAIGGVLRLTPFERTQGFTPFVDGVLGLRVFNTRTKIDKDLWDTVIGDDEPEVIHSKNDNGLGYGVGVGWYIRKPKDGSGKVAFSMRAMYLWGDTASYVKRGSLAVNSGQVSFETAHTETNMIVIQLGLVIY